MPDNTGTPGDGTQGTPDPATPPATPVTGAAETPKPETRTFTQEQLDAIVTDRVARAKPADYDEAKAALEAQRKREEGEKTELQKAQDKAAEDEAGRKAAEIRADNALRSAEIRIEAMKQGGDEELVEMALAADTSIEVKDGKVVGAQKAVEKLLERKPNLKIGTNRVSGGQFGGTDQSTVAEQIAALHQKGDRDSMAEARRLQIAQSIASG
jgi:hypothetical protein